MKDFRKQFAKADASEDLIQLLSRVRYRVPVKQPVAMKVEEPVRMLDDESELSVLEDDDDDLEDLSDMPQESEQQIVEVKEAIKSTNEEVRHFLNYFQGAIDIFQILSANVWTNDAVNQLHGIEELAAAKSFLFGLSGDLHRDEAFFDKLQAVSYGAWDAGFLKMA